MVIKKERGRKRSEIVIKALALSEIFTFLLSSFAFVFLMSMVFSFSLGGVDGAGEMTELSEYDEPHKITLLKSVTLNGVNYPAGTIFIQNEDTSYSSLDPQLGVDNIPATDLLNSLKFGDAELETIPSSQSTLTPSPGSGSPNGELTDEENWTAYEALFNEEENDLDPSTSDSDRKMPFTNFLNPNGNSTYTAGTWGALGANLAEGVQWATVVYGAVALFGGLLNQNGKYDSEIKALQSAAVAGIMAYKATYGLFQSFDKTATTQTNGGGKFLGAQTSTISTVIGLAAAYLAFASQYKKEKETTATIEFKCMPWQAPIIYDKNTRVKECNKCNSDPLMPCSEYRCRSLGQTCKIINEGTSQIKCIDSSPDDTTSPGIKPWQGILNEGYQYSEVVARPAGNPGTPGKMRIINPAASDGCLKAFTPFEFGIITTDVGELTQPAQCKIDFNHTSSFEDMDYWLGDENMFIENHSQVVSMPGTDLLNNLFIGNETEVRVTNDGEYTLYIRCRDGNGNTNEDEFAVRFCIDKTPDLTPPIVVSANPLTNSPVLYGIDNVSANIYTNEPANCKWSKTNADYGAMENNMSCNNQVWEMNAELLYTCNTIFTSIKDRETNQFYIRCKDLSDNAMQQSYSYSLIGTQPLTILTTAPTGIIGSSTSTATITLEVRTDNGYKNGEATCYYSTSSDSGYIAMVESGSVSYHKQPLDLPNGDYTYYLKCVDLGGNTAYNSTSFTVFVDNYAPIAIRAYNLDNSLRVITDEISNCKYSTSSCNFGLTNEGISMPFDNTREHDISSWQLDKTYYVKCSDQYGNQPLPSECSIILRPYELVRLDN